MNIGLRFVAPWVLCCAMGAATAQVSIGIGLPNVSIGINLPVYPQLVRVPDYPVYYAPEVDSNYFFYDGMYWVYQEDNWYASSWYNGPWNFVERDVVPVYVLRIPVRYYRAPPAYFRAWRSDAPPRWGDRWGNDWQQRRSGWDRWDRRAAPAPAPLPVYQRRYSGERYPQAGQQRDLQSQNYRYLPRDAEVRQRWKEPQGPMQSGSTRRDVPDAVRAVQQPVRPPAAVPTPRPREADDARRRAPQEPGRAQSQQRRGQDPDDRNDQRRREPGDDRRQERR
jgi:hypothetical protein